MRVTLVRHARSAPDPSTPAHTWGLSDAGRARARALRLPGVGRLFAGPEPRMRETIEHLGPVEIDERFAESRTGGWLDDDRFVDAVRRYHAGDPVEGWERAADVVERFRGGFVDGAAICSGGRAVSAVVAHLTGTDGFALWRALDMPHVIVLSRDEGDRWIASTVA